MRSEGRFKGSFRAAALVAVLASGAIAAGCSSGSSGTAADTSSSQTVATWAEAPQTPPNYIFPFMSLAFFSVSNSEQFQYLMYRPLYWFGNGATPDLNPSLSLAQQPTYSANTETVTLNLKPYKWSNGETVDAQDVMFWMNMLHAEKANWAGYSPGAVPDDISSITVNSPTQLTMQLTAPVNTYWFTYNQLSQITPMPSAWDITASGAAPDSGGCCHRRLRHRGRRLHRGLHLPVQAGRLRPGQPEGGQQLPVHLRHQPALAGGRRTVEADPLRRQRQRHHGGQQDLLRSDQADDPDLQGGAVHVGLVRVQRAGGRSGRRGLPARGGRHGAHHQPVGGRPEQPPTVGLVLARPALQLVHQLLPVQLHLHG